MKYLPEAIRDALASAWNFEPGSLTFLGGGQDWSDGTLFSAPREGTDLVLKILDFPLDDRDSLGRAEDRIRFVRYFGEQGCRIVTPVPDRSGNLFRTAEDRDRRFLAYAYPKVPGRNVRVEDASVRTGVYYRAVGSDLGRLHAVWEGRGQTVRPDGTGTESRVLGGWRDEMAFFRSWCQEDAVREAWDHLRQELSRLPVGPDRYGFVHNDAHNSNFLFDPEAPLGGSPPEPELTVIDFDVANYHWYMNDCAVALYSFECLEAGGLETEKGAPQALVTRATDLFWEGYRRHRQPHPEDLARLDLFLQYRRCLLFMPLQDQTAKNPEWRSRWVARIVEEDRRLFG